MRRLARIIDDFVTRLERTNLSFWEGAFLLYGIFFFRTFLENFANSGNLYRMSGVIDTFLHYPIFFLIIITASTIIAALITKEKIVKVAKFIVLCSFGLVIPPVIDLIVTGGGQVPYIFIVGSYEELLRSFLTFLGGGAVGLGIRIEAAAVLTAFAIYIFHKTKRLHRALLGAAVLYSVIFLFMASPAFIFIAHNAVTGAYESVTLQSTVDFYYRQEPRMALTDHRTFVLESDNNAYPLDKKTQNQFSITLTIVFFLVHSILFFWSLFLYSKEKFLAVIKNLRYLRIVHNFLLVSLGIYLGMGALGRFPVGSLFDFLSYVSLFMALFFAWLFAVWENDEADTDIDRISNKERPLAQERPPIPANEWRILKLAFLAYSLSFALLCGLYTLVFILMFIFVYHIYQVYSIPPTRLKKFPVLSSLAIAVNSLLMVWMGFFLGAGTESLNAFPARFALGILAVFLLVENAKNLKDIEGDRQEGIRTLPVILGEVWGKRAVGLCLFAGAILVPVVFYLGILAFIVSAIFGAILFMLANRERYEERYLFFAYFAYVLSMLFIELFLS